MTCNHSDALARLSRRIDALQDALAAEKAASAEKLRQIFLAVDYGNKLAEGPAPAVKSEPSPWTPRVLRGGKAAS